MEETEETYVVLPLAIHTHTVILLHGRDSTAVEFAEEFFESQASDGRTLSEIFPNIKWVFPNSKLRNSARFQTDMAQWFDIWCVEEPGKRKELQVTGLRESIKLILNVICEEASSVSTKHIILGGISQGCATAIHALMHCGVQLNGFIGLCGWLPFQEEIGTIARNTTNVSSLQEIQILLNSSFSSSSSPALEKLSKNLTSPLFTPVFLAHSIDDPIVPISNGKRLAEELDRLGMAVLWKAYEDGGHWINEPQGVDDMVDFLQTIVANHN